jgi:PDZ domain-containing protein
MKLPHTFLIACLGAAPLYAQQAEPKAESPKSESSSADASASSSAVSPGNSNGAVKPDSHTAPSKPSHRHPSNAMPQQEQKPVAYIGVFTREVSAELRSQFSLDEGFGLLVDQVAPDSPAKSAGLKKHDVLVKFEDQQLVNLEQLRSLVRAKKKGDVVQFVVISGGKETKVPVTLGELMIAANAPHPHHGSAGWTHPHAMPFSHGDMLHGGDQHGGLQHQSKALHEQMERFQKEMREYQQRIQEWSKAGGHGQGGPMPQPPQLNPPGGHQQQQHGDRHHDGHQPQSGISIPPGANVQQFNFNHSNAASNITRRDDSGEYSLKNEDGKTTFVARPNNGHEKSWPVNNDAERQAVPPEFRDKLRMMDGATSGIRIEINPGPGGNVPGKPAPGAGGDAPAPPPVKGRPTSA